MGCGNTVDERVNGFKVPAKIIEMLVDRLERLILNSELRGRMGRASREKAVADFPVNKIVDQAHEFLNVLDSLAKKF